MLRKQMVEKELTKPGCIHKKEKHSVEDLISCGCSRKKVNKCDPLVSSTKAGSFNPKVKTETGSYLLVLTLISQRLLIAVAWSCDQLELQMEG